MLGDSGVTTILGNQKMYIEWTNRPACKAGPVYPSAVADSMAFLTSSSASARLTKSSIASSNLSIPSLWMKSGETCQQTMQNWKWMEPLNILSATLMFAQTHHWHNRDNSVLLGSCESKQGHGGMWKIPWNTVIFIRKQYHLIIMRDQNPPPPMTDMLNGLTTRHPLWPICWTR